MRNIALASGALGGIVFVLGIIGRFVKEPSISLIGYRFQASTFLTLSNTLLLIGVFLFLLHSEKNR